MSANCSLVFLVPQVHEQPDRCRSVPRVGIIRKGKDFSYALIFHKTPEHDYPTLEIVLPINDRLVPSRRLLLDAFAISKPTDISKVGSDQIECALHFPNLFGERDARHTSARRLYGVGGIRSG